MSSFLTPYQQAVLQEMGIPVWVGQQVVQASPDTSVAEETSPGDGASNSETSGSERIAQLRAVLGTKASSSSPKKPADANAKEKPQPEIPYDRASLGAMEGDITKAIVYCQISISEKWLQGQEVDITGEKLSLPQKMTAEDKKLLWQKIMSISGT